MVKKVLIVAHGHPDHHPGGGEIAAYNLHKKLQESDEFDSVFFARHGNRDLLHGGVPFAGNGKPGEVLFYSTMPEWFRFSQPDKAKVWRDFQELLNTYQPDIVHFHHYLHLGLEFFRQVKNHSPDIPVVLTLHEYCGICHNHGQMVKVQDKALCTEASPVNCSSCFPEYSPQDFFLREQFIKSHFSLVDQFISPSYFLAERYKQWGLAEDRFAVIENMLADENSPLDRSSEDKLSATVGQKIRFGFFGQINWFKGVDLLLNALDRLSPPVREQIQLDINGSGLDKQPAKLRNRINQAIQKHSDIVQLQGAYRQSELDALMSMTDWVVIPSIWWENSPVVILESRKNGVPVLCSDIGGMAEKITPGETGLHFMARRAESLAQKITWIVENPAKTAEYSANMLASYQAGEALAAHQEVYTKLLQGVECNNTESDVANRPEIDNLELNSSGSGRTKRLRVV